MSKLARMTSAVAVVSPASMSIKTTVPAPVAMQMGLDHKDRLAWTLDRVDGKWIATIHKMEVD